jgi:hypothetical protein
MTHTNDAARAAYVTAQQQARALLQQVQNWLDGHQECSTPDDIHWGHVGDVNSVIQGLKNILGDEATT